MLTTEIILQLFISGIVVGAIYSTMALGLTTVYGMLRILHIAHAGVYVIGAYIGFSVYLLSKNILLSFIAAAVSSMIIGLAIEKIIYLPLIKRPKHILLVISIALFIFIEETVANIAGHHPKGFYTNIPNIIISLGNLVISSYQLIVIGISYTALLLIQIFYSRSKIGIASKALIQDMETAEALGINSRRIIDYNFIVGSILAGISGVLVGLYYSNVSPYMGDIVAYKSLVVVVLGGFGSISGTIVGGMILGICESYLTVLFGQILPRDAFAFIVLILLLIFRPQGLFGKME
jgi:branched-chain amino acid transport system permease protein